MSFLSAKRQDGFRIPGYAIAAGIRIALCALVLFFLLGSSARLDYAFAVLVATLVYLAVTIVTLVASIRIGKPLPISVRYGTHFNIVYFAIFSALSGGFQSPLNFLIFFVLIDAATGHKFIRSVRLILMTSGLFGLVSIFTLSAKDTYFDLGLTLGLLTLLGMAIAYRSGHEIELKEQLKLTDQISAIASPRLGLERAIGISLTLLRKHFGVGDCVMFLSDLHTDELSIFRPDDSAPTESHSLQGIADNSLFSKILAMPKDLSVIYYGKKNLWGITSSIVTTPNGEQIEAQPYEDYFADVAEMLDTRQFLTVPVSVDNVSSARIFLLHSGRGARFQSADLKLVGQIARSFAPLIENSRLIDTISSNAAEDERKRIARDIHDSIIQPYLGIKLGLESLAGALKSGVSGTKESLILERIESMRALADSTIEHLRDVVGGLADSKTSGNTLLPSVKRFADKFASATGIRVRITANGDMRLADDLASELFQLAVEGLSNIRKHTDSPTALIEFDVLDDRIRVHITNEGTTNDEGFHPRSIAERIVLLGGTMDIITSDHKCVIELEIPLNQLEAA